MEAAAYISSLTLEEPPVRVRGTVVRGGSPASDVTAPTVVNVGALISFVGKLSQQERDDVLYSVQLAQRAAGGAFDRFADKKAWHGRFLEVLEKVGWLTETTGVFEHTQNEGDLQMDQHALAVVASIASQGALGILTAALGAMKGMADTRGAVKLFGSNSVAGRSGNFQLGAVERSDNGALALAMGAFYFRTHDRRGGAVFATWGAKEIEFWSSAQKLTLNAERYAKVRELVRAKLGDATDFIAGLRLD